MIRVKNNRYIHILAIISIFLFQVVFISSSMVMAADTQSKQYFVDNAGLVYEDKASEINDRLAGISDEYDFDVVIYTSDDASLYDAETAADDFFDYNGYGVGADRSGVVLYINIKTGDRYISTKGFGIEVSGKYRGCLWTFCRKKNIFFDDLSAFFSFGNLSPVTC